MSDMKKEMAFGDRAGAGGRSGPSGGGRGGGREDRGDRGGGGGDMGGGGGRRHGARRARLRPAQGLPLLRRQQPQGRLQERGRPEVLRHRARQDRPAAHLGTILPRSVTKYFRSA